MTVNYPPMCMFCRHFKGFVNGEITIVIEPLEPVVSQLACRAFPKGIPTRIIDGADHRKPYEGDNGIRFELIKGKELEFAKYLEVHKSRMRRNK